MSSQEQVAGSSLLICRQAKPLRRRQLALAAGAVVAVYLAGLSGQWWPGNDSATYLSLGRSLATGQGYSFNGHTNTAFAPGLPAILAAFYRLAGESIWLPNIFATACGLAAILLVYLSLRRLGLGQRAALPLTLAAGTSFTFYFNSHRVMSDMPFTAVFWLLFYCLLRFESGSWGWAVLAAVASAAGVLLRAPAIILLGPLAMGVLLEKRLGKLWPRRMAVFTAVLLPALAVVIVLYLLSLQVPDQLPNYLRVSIPRAGLAAYPLRVQRGMAVLPKGLTQTFINQDSAFLGLLLLALAAAGGVRFWLAGRRAVPIALVGYLLLLAACMGSRSMEARYLAPILPMLILLCAESCCWCVKLLGRWLTTFAKPKALEAAPAVFATIIVLANVPMTGRQVFINGYYSRDDNYYRAAGHEGWADLSDIAKLLQRQCSSQECVAGAVKDLAILHYLSQRQIVSLSQDRGKETHFIVTGTDQPPSAASIPHDSPDPSKFKACYQGRNYTLWQCQ